MEIIFSRKSAWKFSPMPRNRLENIPVVEKIGLEVLPDVEKSLANSPRCRENRLKILPVIEKIGLEICCFEKIDLEIVPDAEKTTNPERDKPTMHDGCPSGDGGSSDNNDIHRAINSSDCPASRAQGMRCVTHSGDIPTEYAIH